MRQGHIIPGSLLLASLLLVAGLLTPLAAQADEDFDDPFAQEEAVLPDPLEPINRGIFWVNDKAYFYVLKPVARGYRVVPEPARISVSNFFGNLATPIRLVNNLLQFKFARAGEELGRFVFNSTVGVLGLFDPAERWLELKERNEDAGQTLGSYGLGHGFYLVLPLLGSSSLRDGVGLFGDQYLDPIAYADFTLWERAGIKTFEQVNAISLDRDTYESVKREQLDPYLFIRDFYAQSRAAKVRE